MKKLLYLFLVVFLASFTSPKGNITISGKILNSEDKKITIKGESFLKEITLKNDGTFSENIEIGYNGTYTLLTYKNKVLIYLGEDSKLGITADENNFNKTLKFTGKGSVENQYIIDKGNLVNAISEEELYQLNETDFLNKIKEMKNAVTVSFEKTTFTQAGFREYEARSINYFEQLCYLKYPNSHAQYAKIKGYKTTTSFPAFDDKINLEDCEDYLFSNTYRQIVITKFEDKILALNNGDEDNMAPFAIPEIEKIKSQCIKNALSQDLIYEMRPGNPNFEYIYHNIMKLSTDEKFKEKVAVKYNKFEKLLKGKPSPVFRFENKNGGFTTLEELKGKYVYIDVWATWCRPCREEIPHLQKIEEEYHGKNVEFVSISVDKKENYEKWLKLVNDKKLGGIQLISDNSWNTEFVKAYVIDLIPRFILVDPNGNIVTSDAPRPSEEKLIDLLNSLQL